MWRLWSGFVILIYSFINVYTGIRVLALARFFLPSFRAWIFWPVYILICYSYIISFFLRSGWLKPFRDVSMFSLPTVLYFFFALLLFDLLRLVLKYTNPSLLTPTFALIGTGVALTLAVLAMCCGVVNARLIRTVHYSVSLEKTSTLPSMRVALISDLHLGGTVDRRWTAKVVDAVNRANPDLVCFTGDNFDSGIDALKDHEGVSAELLRLKAPLGVFGCPGNHDVDRLSIDSRGGATSNRINIFKENAGIRILMDETVFLADSFYLIGRRDVRPIGGSNVRKSAAELVAPLDLSKPVIILDHQPVDYRQLDEAGVDLIFSGHTHAGQFFPGNLITKQLFRREGSVHYGHWRGKIAQGIISSGAGVWGPPIRIATGSEVVIVDIKFGK